MLRDSRRVKRRLKVAFVISLLFTLLLFPEIFFAWSFTRISKLASGKTNLLATLSWREEFPTSRGTLADGICEDGLSNATSKVGKIWLAGVADEGDAPPVRSQTHSECSVKCAHVLKHRLIIWIAGPPASGKSTVVRRMHDYGFTIGDCESVQGNFTQFKMLTDIAKNHGTSSFAFGGCYSDYLEAAPAYVIPVLLLPSESVNKRRFTGRNNPEKNAQDLDHFRKMAIKTFKNPNITTIIQNEDECVDRTVWRVCEAASKYFMNLPIS